MTTNPFVLFRMEAYWHLSGELAGDNLRTSIGGVPVVIHLPEWTKDGHWPRITPPKAFVALPNDSEEPRHIQEAHWGRELGHSMPEAHLETFELAQILLELEVDHKSEEEIDHWAKTHLSGWFERMTDWIEFVAKQVSSTRSRLVQAPVIDNITVWVHQGDTYSGPRRRLVAYLNVAMSDPMFGNSLSRGVFESCLSSVEAGHTPRPFELLLNDARTSFAMKFFRKAVLEASVVIESHLVKMLDASFHGQACQIHGKSHNELTLGELFRECLADEMPLPEMLNEEFIHLRNDAAHKDVPVLQGTAGRALEIADSLICVG